MKAELQKFLKLFEELEEMRKIRENGIKIVFSKKMRLRSETEAKK